MKDFLMWFESEWENVKDELPAYYDFTKQDFKYVFLSSYLFEIATYDMDLDFEFGTAIYKVMKAIKDRKTFDFIGEKKQYKEYIIVCNLLDRRNMIEWGTSIRGAWFTDENMIIEGYGACYDAEGNAIYEHPKITITQLIEWLEQTKD